MIKGKHPFVFLVSVALLVLLASSCTNRNKYVMPEKKFVQVLIDVHLAQAIGEDAGRLFNTAYKIDSAALYGSVFKKHGINMAIFDSTMMYYSRRPEKFQRLFNQVTAELKYMEGKVTSDQEKEDRLKGQTIWSSDSVYTILEGGSKLMIDVPLQDTGTYIVSAAIKILPEDASLDPRMSVYFYSETGTAEAKKLSFSEVRYTIRNGDERVYRSVKRLTDTSFTRLRGYIANYSNGDTLFRRRMVIKNLTVSVRHLNY